VADRPSSLRLLARQIEYQHRVFWRTPIAAIFTVAFPLMLLVLFAALYSGDTVQFAGRPPVKFVQFAAPSLAAFAAASATYTNLAITTSSARDLGLLKRFRGTPLPPWILLGGRLGSSVVLAVQAVVLMLGVGILVYGIDLQVSHVPAALMTFGVGVAVFAALGLAVAGLARSAESAQAIANFTILPLAFISDVFIPVADPPRWMEVLGGIFPLKHFVRGFHDAFSPVAGIGLRWGSLLVMAAWGVGALLVALRSFGWEPRGSTKRRRRAAAG